MQTYFVIIQIFSYTLRYISSVAINDRLGKFEVRGTQSSKSTFNASETRRCRIFFKAQGSIQSMMDYNSANPFSNKIRASVSEKRSKSQSGLSGGERPSAAQNGLAERNLWPGMGGGNSRAPSRLYQGRCMQSNVHFSAFSENIYTLYTIYISVFVLNFDNINFLAIVPQELC